MHQRACKRDPLQLAARQLARHAGTAIAEADRRQELRNALGARARIIGVGAANADGVYRSWKGPGRVVGESAQTFAEGIATRVSFDLPFSIYKQYLDDFVLLTEEELAEGVRMALKTTHNLPEGAGSASIAAAYKLRQTLAEQRVVCIMSGGNIDAAKLKWVLSA